MITSTSSLAENLADLLLAPGGGRVAASRTLSWLLTTHSARCIGLWEVDPAPTLRLSVNLDQECLEATLSAWSTAMKTLAAGTPWINGGTLVLPVRSGETLFLVTLDGVTAPNPRDLETAASYARVAAKAFQHAEAASLARPTDMKREELLALLRREDWNLSRVARLSQISRKTLYQRMRRYAIPREHVAKS
jgi:hypothetical protein